MGFLSRLFGGSLEYPPLDAANPASVRLAGLFEGLKALAEKTTDRMEVVPADGKAFVFVGKPPKQFGLVWVRGKELTNLKSYIAQHQMDPKRAEKVVEALAQAYQRSQPVKRYVAEVAGRDFVVTPSERLAMEVERILERAAGA